MKNAALGSEEFRVSFWHCIFKKRHFEIKRGWEKLCLKFKTRMRSHPGFRMNDNRLQCRTKSVASDVICAAFHLIQKETGAFSGVFLLESVIKDLRIVAQFGICILDADECVRICCFDRLTQVRNLILLRNDDDDVGPFASVNAGTVQKGCAMNEMAQGICDLV